MSSPSKPHWTDRFVDVASVALISLAAVLTAVCGYQSALRATERTRLFNEAEVHRVAAAAASGRANALETIDVGLYVQYIVAEKSGNPSLQQYIAQRFRPEMQPAMKAWLATKPDARPSSPFVMPEYRLASDAVAKRESATADDDFTQAQNAGALSDAFVRGTVTFATVSFLAAMSTKFRYPFHLIMIVLSALIFAYGLWHLTKLRFVIF